MREILFRGKRLDNGEWVEGGLVLPNHELPDGAGLFLEGKAFLCADLYSIRVEGYGKKMLELAGFVEIDPETVGQYTGLCDKNGKKIFEGDVVRLLCHVHSINPLELVEYCGGGFSPFAIPGWECTPDADDAEVIGNIHDNPELLGEG